MHYIYYHEDLDGIFAGLIVSRYLGNVDKQLIPINYGVEIEPVVYKVEDTVWIVDFSLGVPQTVRMDNYGCKIKWFDHHITAKDVSLYDLFRNVEKHFDTKRSGCGIVWDVLMDNAPRPRVIKFIEDMDIWQFKYAETKSFIEGINCIDLNQENVDKLFNDEDDIIDTTMKSGEVCLIAKNKRIERILKDGAFGYIDGERAFYVNATSDISDIGDYICKKYQYPIVAVIYRYAEPNKIKVSLRSIFVDVAKIATKYGGGGHILAAGFELENKHSLYKKLKGDVNGYEN